MIETNKIRETNNYKLEKIEINAINNDKLFCGSLKAYFSTYNTVNLRPDRMIKGCFDKEFTSWKNNKMPRFVSQHNLNEIIGIIEAPFNDEFGAGVSGKFINTTAGKDAYIELKTKAKDEFSFSWYCTDSYYVEENGVSIRNVLEVSGIDEISLVTFGIDPLTKAIEVNNKELTIREAEQALKNAGFSSKQSKTILANGFNYSDRDDREKQRDVDEAFNNGLLELTKSLGKD